MHQNRWRLGLRLRPHWKAYSTPTDPIDGFKGPTSKFLLLREREKGGGKVRGRDGRGRRQKPSRRHCQQCPDAAGALEMI